MSGGRQIAECEWVYEIVANGQPTTSSEAPRRSARQQVLPADSPLPATLPERVVEQINKIQTVARAAEAHALGACFRDAANRFDTEQLPADADIAVLQPGASTFDQARMTSTVKWSPYDGRPLAGHVAATYVRGQRVFADGEVLAQPGYGQFVRPG